MATMLSSVAWKYYDFIGLKGRQSSGADDGHIDQVLPRGRGVILMVPSVGARHRPPIGIKPAERVPYLR